MSIESDKNSSLSENYKEIFESGKNQELLDSDEFIRNAFHIAPSNGTGLTVNSDESASLKALSGGPFFNDKSVRTGDGNDSIIGHDIDVNDDPEAIGVANEGFLATQRGHDLVLGTGAAQGVGEATAFGILNQGELRMGRDNDVTAGFAVAVGLSDELIEGSATAAGYSEIDLVDGGDTGVFEANAGADVVIGKAIAKGTDNTGAFGLQFADASTGRGDDLIVGIGIAEGRGSTDARGISVGISDVDDDVFSPPFGPAEVGRLSTGRGSDTLEGTAQITVDAGADDQVFFAGANAILVDGGAEAQWVQIVNDNLQLLADAVQAGRQAVREALPALLAQIDTSSLDTGNGRDKIIAKVELAANGLGFEVDPDDDLEVIADAIENAGTMSLGAGNDHVMIELDIRSTIDGAKALGDPLDNSSVGLITGYGAIATAILQEEGLISEEQFIDVEVNNSAIFDLGDGNDKITSNTFATALDDLSAGDGLGNRGLWIGGNGSETLDLTTVSVFVLGEVVEGDNEQREGIADGWETRSIVFLDDVVFGPDGAIEEGSTDGDGADKVKANATAFGNGVLTIADGFEGREFTNTGGGNDKFDLTAAAFTTPVDRTDPLQVAVLAQNITVATGLQTEQVDEGDFLMRDGNDSVIGRATAAPALGLDPFNFKIGDFTEEAFDPLSEAFANRATIAQGISQVTGDANATNDGSVDLGLIDTSGSTGPDEDLLDGEATAFGTADVQAYGILLTNAVTGKGIDTLNGDASATGRNVAWANGIAVGITNNTDNDGQELRPDQAGSLLTGDDGDVLNGFAVATTTTDGTARQASGVGDGSVVVSDANADSNGVLVDLNSTLNLGEGDNEVVAEALASDQGVGGVNTAVTADGLENRGTLLAGSGNDEITGTAAAESAGGVLLTVAGGIDSGFGSTRADIPAEPLINTGDGDDTLEGTSTVVAQSGIGLASGIETSGTIITGAGADEIIGKSSAEVTDGINAVADGIENSDIAGGTGGVIETRSGADKLVAEAVATGFATNAEAIAIRNDFVDLVNPADDTDDQVIAEGQILLGAGSDSIEALAEASSDTGEATAVAIRGGTIDLGDGQDDLFASAVVSEASFAEVFGLSVGTSVVGGAGDDVIEGRASAGADVNVAQVGGIFLGSDAELETGDGDDMVIGRADSDANFGAAFGIRSADSSALIATGEGNDTVDGGSGGLGLLQDDAFRGGFKIETGAGDDEIIGFGNVRLDGGEGVDDLILEGVDADDVVVGTSGSFATLEVGGIRMFVRGVENVFDDEGDAIILPLV